MFWVESNYGIVWRDAECDDNSQRAPQTFPQSLGQLLSTQAITLFQSGQYNQIFTEDTKVHKKVVYTTVLLKTKVKPKATIDI